MKREKITLDFGKKKISVKGHALSEFGKVIGLMFSRKEKAKILFFKFSKPARIAIHSLFVFFPFVAVWANERGKVVEIREVRPFSLRVCPAKKFSLLVEIPINRKNKHIVVGIEKFK